MAQRLDLQVVLEGLLESRNVYFQPPPNIQMSYPCIVYQRDNIRTDYADNIPIRLTTRYVITVIDRNPDSNIPAKIAALPLCSFDRFYTADNLNHDVYNIFF